MGIWKIKRLVERKTNENREENLLKSSYETVGGFNSGGATDKY